MNSTGEAHWEVLLRARAIENQCYVVAAAQVGRNHEYVPELPAVQCTSY
jgi:predicted amidohydrolase